MVLGSIFIHKTCRNCLNNRKLKFLFWLIYFYFSDVIFFFNTNNRLHECINNLLISKYEQKNVKKVCRKIF
jgi:hypothetical protein